MTSHRRALSGLLPPESQDGDPEVSAVLFEALDHAAHADADVMTHGFHSYPARMHWAIAAHVLDAWAEAGARVLDPFCGSGTVLVEARRRGLTAAGSDLNPLALMLTEQKTRITTAKERAALRAAVEEVTEASKERVRARAHSYASLDGEVAKQFEPHVLRELAGLLEEIGRRDEGIDRDALVLCFSSIVTKVSKRKADSDADVVQKRIGRFIPSEMFQRKGHELVERLEALAADAPAGKPPALFLKDARTLKDIIEPASIGLILTSPPYGGTYDYARHHDVRMAWLGLDARLLERNEIGARRNALRGRSRFDEEVRGMLLSFSEVLLEGGVAAVLMGDGEIAGERIPVLEQFEALLPGTGLALIGSATAPRLDWKGGPRRDEHLVALQKLAVERAPRGGKKR